MAAAQEVKPIRGQFLHVAPYHHRSTWGDMPGLRDSIAAEGIIMPLLVRPLGRKDGGGYEIVHGVRRFKAGTMADLKTFPCLVEELDEADAIAKQDAENRQRENIHPMDEALYCEEYSKRGQTTEMIAKRTGRKKRDVIRRLSLLALGKAAREAFVAGKFDEEAALSFAQLKDAGRQRDVLAGLDAGTLQPEEITAYVRRTFTASLEDVPWRKSDDKLVVKAGACSTCPKRSDVQRDLFPEGTTGVRCLDVDCWRAKMDATWSIEIAKEGASIHEQDATALFIPQSSGRPVVTNSSGMVDASALCPHVDGYSWREAVEKALEPGAQAPTIYLARDHDGRPRSLMRESIVSRLVKRSAPARQHVDDEKAADPHRPDDTGPNPRSEGRVRRKIIAKLAELAIASDHDTWAWVVERLLPACTARAQSAAAELLESAVKALDPPGKDGVEGLVQLAHSSNRQARRVATAVMIFEEADVVGEIGEPIRALAAACEIDLGTIEREIRGAS